MRIVSRRSGASVLMGIGVGLLVFSALKGGAHAQDSTDLISLQARVLQDGVPSNADLDLTFEVYETSSGGSPIWSEHKDDVPVRNGILSVKLGTDTALGDVFKGGYSNDRYVAVKLGGNEIVPRIKLTAVPYAHRASSALITSQIWSGSAGLSITDLDARYVNNAGEIAGAGLEDDGSGGDGALRIASSAAGDGLTGGGGSALSVNATAIAGDGLTGSGAVLAVNPGSGVSITGDAVTIVPADLINGGSAVVNGDRLEIDYSPTNYTRDPTGVASDVKDLSAHLKGIDTALAGGGGSGITNVVLRVFDSSTTYFPTSGMTRCLVICTGGGGGGGGADGDGSTGQAVAGGGGGGGSTSIQVLSSASVGASQTVTIGAAGSAGTSSGGSGGAGGQTSLGSLVTAPGGSGGTGGVGSGGGHFIGATGGAGGSKSSSSSLLGSNGGRGDTGFIVANSPPGLSRGGDGGGSFWSSGGSGASKTHVSNGSLAGQAGDSYGAGGGGAGHVNTTSGAPGGAGKAGVCVIVEYIQ